MDLNIVAQIVGIVSGIIAIILGLPKIFPPSSETQSPYVKLLYAIGIVIFLVGGLGAFSVMLNIDSNRASCLQGRDQISNNIIQICDQYASSKYYKEVKPGLIAIGVSFLLLATALLIQNFRTATVFQFTLVIIWLVIGIWLIQSNL